MRLDAPSLPRWWAILQELGLAVRTEAFIESRSLKPAHSYLW